MRTLGLAVIRARLPVVIFSLSFCVSFFSSNDASHAGEPNSGPDATKPTHELTKKITVKGTDPKNSLQTLCLSPDGNVVALVAEPRHGPASSSKSASEIQVFDSNGKSIRK